MSFNYDLDKIKFGVDSPTFEKALDLYESGKVTKFKEEPGGYMAIVKGTHPYHVFVSARYYDRGNCDCYLGGQNILCKHMVAVAIYAIAGGSKLSEEDKELINGPKCSNILGELDKEELAKIKKEITTAMSYVKAYIGPSKFWNAYQNSLSEGCARLSKIVSNLPISEQTSKLLINMLLRLDKKLCTGGVDDSDGAVSGFIEDTVLVLEECAKIDPKCIKAFKKLCGQDTCFGWEKPLVRIEEQ